MAGEVKLLIDELMRLRSRGNPSLVPFVRVHLMLHGIDPDKHTADSPGNPQLEQQLRKMIADFSGTTTDGAS